MEERAMNTNQGQEDTVLYKFYREIAADLCMPVSSELDLEVRFELYNSKLVYLKHIWQKCFRDLNSDSAAKMETPNEEKRGVEEEAGAGAYHFTENDLKLIKAAIELTNAHICDTVREALQASLSQAGKSLEGKQQNAAANRNPT